MENKKFYFLCGLPRAGNTLLTSLLNQNPKIACTPNAFTSNITEAISKVETTLEYMNAPNNESLRNLLRNIYPSFYKDWKQKYIIERGLAGMPSNFEYLINYVDKDLKIVFLFRPVLEVLASFVAWSKKNPVNFLEGRTATNDEICDRLMEPDGLIMKQLSCMANLMVPCNKKNGLIINFNDLVTDTKLTLDRVYNFLNIPKYKHQFTNLKQVNINGIKYDDSVVGNNLHKIRTGRISLSKTKVEKILSKKIIKKYSDVQINIS
tara:strand:+ start:509 stop:1300 length:792 start_codon:yes stop_codon:yes gene_type:complete